MLVSGKVVDQILLFLHMLFQCIWDHYSNHRLVSFVGKTANGTMNQLCSEDYDLSGSGCFRRISHFIRDPILTGCSYSISLINLLGQQTSPIFFGGGQRDRIHQVNFQHPNGETGTDQRCSSRKGLCVSIRAW